MPKKPKLIVFDLDYTLWPFWVDTHVSPPFHKENNKIVDLHGEKIKHYPEVPEVLQWLHNDGFKLGVASRTSEIRGANQLIDLFGWSKYFCCKEIYPGCKVTHFHNFKKGTGLSYNDMLFFDDEMRNITDLKAKGVTSILVGKGITRKVVEEGLEQYAKEHA